MWPAIVAAARTYAPWIVLPFAVVIGGLGYVIEGSVSDKYTPWKKAAIGKWIGRAIEVRQMNF